MVFLVLSIYIRAGHRPKVQRGMLTLLVIFSCMLGFVYFVLILWNASEAENIMYSLFLYDRRTYVREFRTRAAKIAVCVTSFFACIFVYVQWEDDFMLIFAGIFVVVCIVYILSLIKALMMYTHVGILATEHSSPSIHDGVTWNNSNDSKHATKQQGGARPETPLIEEQNSSTIISHGRHSIGTDKTAIAIKPPSAIKTSQSRVCRIKIEKVGVLVL